ncbi:hypothetical protein Dacsa_1912 [Dactylococcopsis salina PCC 8305]|uniref:Uncharacterized protein n=2 Tax=Dactylococcopsis salina TaxID=292566 RepID=K9YUG3_DACS8|nr:hypothetical protein Dacsa_1912 [Dactylococcopsis salina PCC 8305]
MDNWTKEFLAFCDSVNQEIESFFAEMEELPQLINEAIVEMEETLTEELELFSQDCEELFTFLVTEIDETEEEESDSEFVVTSKVYPDQNTHPACQGCRHYHGYVYGGNLFVCGMHPYGWDDENCPDWEQ